MLKDDDKRAKRNLFFKENKDELKISRKQRTLLCKIERRKNKIELKKLLKEC